MEGDTSQCAGSSSTSAWLTQPAPNVHHLLRPDPATPHAPWIALMRPKHPGWHQSTPRKPTLGCTKRAQCAPTPPHHGDDALPLVGALGAVLAVACSGGGRQGREAGPSHAASRRCIALQPSLRPARASATCVVMYGFACHTVTYTNSSLKDLRQVGPSQCNPPSIPVAAPSAPFPSSASRCAWMRSSLDLLRRCRHKRGWCRQHWSVAHGGRGGELLLDAAPPWEGN